MSNGNLDKLVIYFKSKGLIYNDINKLSATDIDLLHTIIFVNKNVLFDDTNMSPNMLNYLGITYFFLNDSTRAIIYYLVAIEKGSVKAMNNLGSCFKIKNNTLTKKYYLMAIEKGNIDAMYNLGHYYQYNEKNYDLMKKYYLMAIEKGHVYAMFNLACHYKDIEKSEQKQRDYCIMLIETNPEFRSLIRICDNYTDALRWMLTSNFAQIINHYENIKSDLYDVLLTYDPTKTIKMVNLLLDNKILDDKLISIKNIIEQKLCRTTFQIQKCVSHICYKPDGIGYLNAKNHFNHLCQKINS